jgi:hypothetical protein
MNIYQTMALEIGTIVAKKNLAYGNSVTKSGDVLRILYPNGISLEQYDDLPAITRIIDKLFRIVTHNDPFDEDPWNDIMGYALLRNVNIKTTQGDSNGEMPKM